MSINIYYKVLETSELVRETLKLCAENFKVELEFGSHDPAINAFPRLVGGLWDEASMAKL